MSNQYNLRSRPRARSVGAVMTPTATLAPDVTNAGPGSGSMHGSTSNENSSSELTQLSNALAASSQRVSPTSSPRSPLGDTIVNGVANEAHTDIADEQQLGSRASSPTSMTRPHTPSGYPLVHPPPSRTFESPKHTARSFSPPQVQALSGPHYFAPSFADLSGDARQSRAETRNSLTYRTTNLSPERKPRTSTPLHSRRPRCESNSPEDEDLFFSIPPELEGNTGFMNQLLQHMSPEQVAKYVNRHEKVSTYRTNANESLESDSLATECKTDDETSDLTHQTIHLMRTSIRTERNNATATNGDRAGPSNRNESPRRYTAAEKGKTSTNHREKTNKHVAKTNEPKTNEQNKQSAKIRQNATNDTNRQSNMPSTNTKSTGNEDHRATSQIPANTFVGRVLRAGLKSDDSSSDDGSPSDSSSSSTSSVHSGKSIRHRKRIRRQKNKKRTHNDKAIPPFKYRGDPNFELFQKWLFEVIEYFKTSGIPRAWRLNRLQRFLEDRAGRFFFQQVVLSTREWTLEEFLNALFNHCFSANFRTEQRARLAKCVQRGRTLAEWVVELQNFAGVVGDVSERQLVLNFWHGADSYIRSKWAEAGFNPEIASFDELQLAAERYEEASRYGRHDQQNAYQTRSFTPRNNHGPFRTQNGYKNARLDVFSTSNANKSYNLADGKTHRTHRTEFPPPNAQANTSKPKRIVVAKSRRNKWTNYEHKIGASSASRRGIWERTAHVANWHAALSRTTRNLVPTNPPQTP